MNIYRCLIGITISLIFYNHTVMAQYKGHIYDSQTRYPVEGARVEPMEGQPVFSDKTGYFYISISKPGDTLKVMKSGYKTQLVYLDPGIPTLNIQLEADVVNLNEVRVVAFNTNKIRRETPGAISVLNAADINRGNGLSLQGSLNSIPGVRMDQSTLSEARISIRGNGVRSAFGIRNIKIYLNEIPVTEADGTTRIEALDVNSIGRAEILRGPASSIYGAGTGGVINFQLQRSPYQEQSMEVSGLNGAYGLNRLATTYRNGGDKLNSFISYGWQEYKGYRRHSSDKRRFLTSNFQLFPSDKRIITFLLNRTTQHSQIPGALTKDAMQADPLQASQTNLDKAAARYQNWTRIGLGQQYHFNEKFSNSSSVFTYFYDLNHPLPYAYIRNLYQSYGGRTRFSFDPGFRVLSTTFSVGAEFNEGLTKGTQYVNNHGTEGAIMSNNDLRNTAYILFYQSETKIAAETSLTFGLSYNKLTYRVYDYLKPNRTGSKKFAPQVSPRVALSHNFSEALSLHGSISSGFSPPSGSELKSADGSINTALQAERGINYEINAKGNLLKSRLSYDLSLFKMDMRGELIAQAVQQGISVYHNSGKTQHQGVELALSWLPISRSDNKYITTLRPFAAVTYSDFKFEDYKILNAQNQVISVFDGNKLTGIAPWVINTGIDVESRDGWYFYASYFFNDKMPLNDAGTDYNPSYKIFNSKIGYRKRINSFEMNLSGGLDNILNQSYSSITALNAISYGGAQPAYFNPSPKRNGYAGLSVKYFLK